MLSSTQSPADDSNALKVDSFSYDDSIVRMFLLATLVWGLLGSLVGLLVAVLLVMPQLGSIETMSFGRLRPLHTNATIFAFAGNAIFAAVYYSTQRLCKARMWSDLLSRLHFWGWQTIIVAAAVTLPLGITQSKEYAELEWPIDIAIAIVWLLIFGTNFLMTLVNRRERHMYVSLWFYIATIVAVAILHVFNNLVVPSGWFKSYSVYAGVQDAMLQWWYGHNAIAFFLTMPFLGLMYYFVPKAAERPVFSYKLAIIHFWSLVLIHIWAAPHHLHYSSVATWVSTMGMIFSLMLWMPSWGGVINGLLTLRGAWHNVISSNDTVLKFFAVGITVYGFSSFEGILFSIRSVNAFSHYTDWTIAHAHFATMGWNGFLTFGMLYWMLPRLFQTKLYSTKLAAWHFWLGGLGILLFIVPTYVAGVTHSLMLQAFTSEGYLAYLNFIDTVSAIVPMWWARIVGGTLYVIGMALMAYNCVMTWRSRPATYEVPVIQAAPLRRDYAGDPQAPESRLKNAPVLATANKIDVFEQMVWHRKWERLPVRFTVYVFLAVAVASILELVPAFLIHSSVPLTGKIKPYTPLEVLGRDIYISEGCYNCHSQQIRPLFADTERYGEYSRAEEGIYDRPFQWGSRRIGPDLAREGGRNTHFWHYQHFINPRSKTPESVMPNFPHFQKELNFKSLRARMAALIQLGTPYSEDVQKDPEADAIAQAKKIVLEMTEQARTEQAESKELKWELVDGLITTEYGGQRIPLERTQMIALIAYIQRLGVDLSASEPAPGATVSEATESATAASEKETAASATQTEATK